LTILCVISSILPTYFQKSISQKKIIVMCLGIIVLATVPFLDSVFAITTITVGDAPRDVHLVESRNLLFVTNQLSNSVSIINTTSNEVINEVTVQNTPIESVYVPSTKLLYVTSNAGDTVSVIDIAEPLTASVSATITVQTLPFNIDYSSANKQVYVSNSFGNSVSVIDADSANIGTFNTVVKTIPVGAFPTGLDVNDSTNKIYVGNLVSNTVSVIDGSTNAVVSTLDVFGAGEIGIDELHNHIFVANAFSSALTIIDGATDTAIDTIATGKGPRESQYNPNTDQIFVTNVDSGTISVFDGTSFTSLGEIPVSPSPLGIDISTSDVIYVASQDIDSVSIIDLFSNVPPVAKAGLTQAVFEGEVVQLDGSASSDFNGDSLTFQWTQTFGPNVILSSSSATNPTFNAPDVDVNTLFEFQLIVNDGVFDSLADFVKVAVIDPSTFEVPLNFVGSQLEGSITLDKFLSNNQITFDFINPDGITEGTLEDVKLASTVETNSNIEFEFIVSTEEPDTVPPLNDPALYFEIENDIIDFSIVSNLPSNNFPTSQFLVDKNYDAGDNFSDGCPIVDVILLDEDGEEPKWENFTSPEISNTNTIYGLDRINHQVYVIDGNTNEKISSIKTGEVPSDAIFVPTLNKLYVANLNSGTIDIINTLTNTVQNTLPFAGAGSLDIDPTTGKIYVASFGFGNIAVIDTATDTIVDTIVVGTMGAQGANLNNIDINSELQRLYLNDSANNGLFVVDIASKTTTDFLPLNAVPTGIVFNQNNNLVYIALFTANSVAVVDGVTNEIIGEIPVGAGPAGVELNSVTNRVFVANAISGTVSVIDPSINAGIGTIPVPNFGFFGGVLNIAVNENTDRLYLTNQAFSNISVLDGSKMEVLDMISGLDGIFGITNNPAVSNPARDPSRDILDSGTNEILECAYIAKLPHLSKFAVGGVRIGGSTVQFLGGSGGGTGAPTASLGTLSSNQNFYIPDEIIAIIDNFDPRIPLAPMDPNLFEDFDFPLTINYNPYNGYPLVGYENTIETNVVQVGTPITLEFMLLEETEIQHFSLYSGLYGSKSNPTESNIQILYNKDMELEVRDPLGSITDVNVTKNKIDDLKTQMVVEFTPTKENSMKDLIIRTWDPNLSSLDTIIRNAFEIVPDGVIETPITTYEEPIIEELQSQTIPIWIKNNAGWWADQQIGDSDFVAGIEYLIKNKIINVPGVEIGTDSESAEIPDWIKNNAGWWAEFLITDKDFTEAMQWLVANGVIQI
jgi:YVTN family beta-propeller protein